MRMRWMLFLGSVLVTVVVVGSAVLVLIRSGSEAPAPHVAPPAGPLPASDPTPVLTEASDPIRVYVLEPLPPPSVSVDLQPGTNEFVYTGVAQPLARLLFPLVGSFTTVTVRAPNGQQTASYAGLPDDFRVVVLPGSVVSIVMTEAASLAW